MSILVTGASGFIGSRLFKALEREGGMSLPWCGIMVARVSARA